MRPTTDCGSCRGHQAAMVLDGQLCTGDLGTQPGVDPPCTSQVKYRGSVLLGGIRIFVL